ncbi:hypothetical protein CDAR_58131 [Caerostris darwini]|uniref:Uncharacterized protein n=1 Tax=Caerostris darwini TaxID=1538125 RepID=A0AAV4U774_9ARAC|nr:hypothetical protein CDAR_58131 [Caerostris darwini]
MSIDRNFLPSSLGMGFSIPQVWVSVLDRFVMGQVDRNAGNDCEFSLRENVVSLHLRCYVLEVTKSTDCPPDAEHCAKARPHCPIMEIGGDLYEGDGLVDWVTF